MNFTTSIFIFVFFPIAIAIYLLVEYLERRKIFSAFFTRFRINDVCLIVLSMLFYMWACFDDIIVGRTRMAVSQAGMTKRRFTEGFLSLCSYWQAVS